MTDFQGHKGYATVYLYSIFRIIYYVYTINVLMTKIYLLISIPRH